MMNTVRRAYIHTEFRKDIETAKRQRDFVGVTDFYGMKVAVMRNAVKVNWVEDCGDSWYIGVTPALKSEGNFGWGCIHVYKDTNGRPVWQHDTLTDYDYNKTFAENIEWKEA